MIYLYNGIDLVFIFFSENAVIAVCCKANENINQFRK